MSPKISIILPVYNAGEYLAPCLDSLLAQTLRDIEVIVVLDCPTDGSDRVAEDYARRDNRIVLLKNDRNLHTGLSRNRGLDVACGEYVGFADHDDVCAPDMYEILYSTAQAGQADVVISDACEILPDGTRQYCPLPAEIPAEGLRRAVLRSLVSGRYSVAGIATFDNVNSIWTELVRRDLLEKHHIRFPDNRKATYEDALFNVAVWLYACRVVHVPHSFYFHRQHDTNTFMQYDYKSYARMDAYLHILQDTLKEAPDGGDYTQLFDESVLRRLYGAFRNELHHKGIIQAWRLFLQIRRSAWRPVLRRFAATPNAHQLALGKRLFLLLLA